MKQTIFSLIIKMYFFQIFVKKISRTKLNFILILGICLASFINANAQTTSAAKMDIDSLKNILSKTKNVNEKQQILKHLTKLYWGKNATLGMQYLKELEEVTSEHPSPEISAYIFDRYGRFYYRKGKIDSARLCSGKAADFFDKAGLPAKAVKARITEGIFYSVKGDYNSAEKIIRKEMKKAIEGNFSSEVAFANTQIGTLFHYQGMTDSAIHYYSIAENLFRELKDTAKFLVPMTNQVSILNGKRQFKKAIEKQLGIIEIQKKSGRQEAVMRALGVLASSYKGLGDYRKALNYSLEEKKLIENIGDDLYKISNLEFSADIYTIIEDFETAESLLLESLELSRKAESKDVLIGTLNHLGNHYINNERYSEGEQLLAEALDEIESAGKSHYKKVVLMNYGLLNFLKNEFSTAEAYFKQALDNLTDNDDNYVICNANWFLSKILLEKKQPKEAIRYAKIGFTKSAATGDQEFNMKTAKVLAEAHGQIGTYKKAYFYQGIVNGLKDSLSNTELTRSVTKLTQEYEFGLKTEQLKFEQAQKETELKIKNTRAVIIAGSTGLMALFALGFFFNARRKNKIIAEAKDQLEQLNHTKDRIFAIIGHDLRKPVVAFSGISETINYLIKKEDYSTLQQLGTEIEKDGFALQKLTDNLLNWALTQRDVMPYNPTQVNVSQKAEEIALIFEKVARDKNIELVNAVPEGQTAFADPNALLTILVNLTDNALKYTPEGGRVEITANDSDEGLQIRVSDTGIGIAAEQLEDIFLLQKDKSQKGTEGEKGTGLGLHLVNELVKLNGGEITARSSVGKGTTFSVSLPTKQLKAA